MSEPFKPCPFCGSANQTMIGPTCDRNTPYDPNDRAFPIVRCFGCITDVSGQDFDASGKTAIEAWNRRSDADAAAERDRLREAIKPAYLGLLVLKTMCRKAGLVGGVEATESAMKNLVEVMPELPAISALRGSALSPVEESK